MTKIISSTLLLIISAALFAQTSSAPQPQTKDTKGKTSATPNQIAVSDPGVPNKTAAPAPSPATNDVNKPKGKAKGHSKHHK